MSWLDDQLTKIAEKIGQIVAEKVMALLPTVVASAVTTARANASITVDQLTENIRQNIQTRTGIKLPTLTDILKR